MPRPVHFDVTADDPERAVKFYGDVFGWTASKWEGPMDYWMLTTGPDGEPGINGGLSKRNPQAPSPVSTTIAVGDLEASASKIRECGGKTLGEPMQIPGVGRFLMCSDTEGNAFGIMQFGG